VIAVAEGKAADLEASLASVRRQLSLAEEIKTGAQHSASKAVEDRRLVSLERDMYQLECERLRKNLAQAAQPAPPADKTIPEHWRMLYWRGSASDLVTDLRAELSEKDFLELCRLLFDVLNKLPRPGQERKSP
jgi:hypothetical protein